MWFPSPSPGPSFLDLAFAMSRSSLHSCGRSLLFWACLLISASLFALTALSPKLVRQQSLVRQWNANESHLAGLQAQIHVLERIADSMRRDPDYVARMTGVRQSSRLGIEDPLVPEGHRVPDQHQSESPQSVAQPPLTIWASVLPLMTRVALVPGFSFAGLSLSAALLVLGFVMPAHSRPQPIRRQPRRRFPFRLNWLRNRYRRAGT